MIYTWLYYLLLFHNHWDYSSKSLDCCTIYDYRGTLPRLIDSISRRLHSLQSETIHSPFLSHPCWEISGRQRKLIFHFQMFAKNLHVSFSLPRSPHSQNRKFSATRTNFSEKKRSATITGEKSTAQVASVGGHRVLVDENIPGKMTGRIIIFFF